MSSLLGSMFGGGSGTTNQNQTQQQTNFVRPTGGVLGQLRDKFESEPYVPALFERAGQADTWAEEDDAQYSGYTAQTATDRKNLERTASGKPVIAKKGNKLTTIFQINFDSPTLYRNKKIFAI